MFDEILERCQCLITFKSDRDWVLCSIFFFYQISHLSSIFLGPVAVYVELHCSKFHFSSTAENHSYDIRLNLLGSIEPKWNWLWFQCLNGHFWSRACFVHDFLIDFCWIYDEFWTWRLCITEIKGVWLISFGRNGRGNRMRKIGVDSSQWRTLDCTKKFKGVRNRFDWMKNKRKEEEVKCILRPGTEWGRKMESKITTTTTIINK